ncbi:MAG: hypothetical protein ABSE39_10930 [Candidatus Bathyarchaeia archaeon]|jgi:hypothetical protein
MGSSSYSFDSQTIGNRAKEGRVGNFALGNVRDGTFYPKYVGRSDSDLQAELKAKLSTKSSTRQRFKFSYASSLREAFEKECANYHDFNGLENENHPPRPEGQRYACPNSSCQELE